MNVRVVGLGIVLVLGVPSGTATAQDVTADEAALSQYRQRQLEIYDVVTADSSPRTQVLAARLSLDKDDLHLRPKVSDIVARATNFAPDDAFVQWTAADAGGYWSSQCGPAEYPESAVASLVRLESDNAGALSYAVALAQVKGDANAVDESLARMAGAKRADDHRGEEIAAWRAVYLAHPAADAPQSDDSLRTSEQNALTEALLRAGSYASAAKAVENACRPDARSDNPWQRLGYCVDAGILLARKGNSFALRDEGIAILQAAGATSDDLADLEREIAWLKANAASIFVNTNAFGDAPADAAADWNGAPSEIEATLRRLARLGLPATPPATWAQRAELDAPPDPAEASAAAAWRDYLSGLVGAMRESVDVHEKALAIASSPILAWVAQRSNEIPASADADRASLVALAASHRDDALVSWIAATFVVGPGVPDAATLANLQRIDGDNAAAWALSLGAPDADTDATLRSMAASSHYDERYIELLGIWSRAVQRHAVTDETLDAYASLMPTGVKAGRITSADMRGTTSVMFATAGSVSMVRYSALADACTNAAGERQASCIAIARLMFDGARSLMAARIGEMLLGKTAAFDQSELERARRIDWWYRSATEALADGSASGRYVEDTLAAKNEIEALRLAATRAGKAEPPPDWKWKSQWAPADAPE